MKCHNCGELMFQDYLERSLIEFACLYCGARVYVVNAIHLLSFNPANAAHSLEKRSAS